MVDNTAGLGFFERMAGRFKDCAGLIDCLEGLSHHSHLEHAEDIGFLPGFRVFLAVLISI